MKCLKPMDEERRASNELDKKIQSWMKDYDKVIKLLLLGSGESGKTTIIKQMKILHISGFTDEERIGKITEIHNNIAESMKELVHQTSTLGIPLRVPRNESSFRYFQSLELSRTERSKEFYHHALKLWRDPGIQECVARANEFHFMDCATYFLNKLEEIRKPDYVPTDQDILRARRITNDIQKIEFEVKVPKKYGGGSQAFWMFDVGGQRGQRKKWIQVFEGIHAILFLADCSGFDQVLREDNSTNRLQESINLFEDVWHSRFLQECGFILFLNKQDILEEKIQRGTDLGQYFPAYQEYVLDNKDVTGENQFSKARAFIRDIFLKITKKNKSAEKGQKIIITPELHTTKPRHCYWHYTTATDTNNVRTVFDDVHTMIIVWNLEKLGAH